MNKDIIKRSVTGIILISVLIVCFHYANWPMLIVFSCLGMIGYYEWAKLKLKENTTLLLRIILILILIILNYISYIKIIDAIIIFILLSFFASIILNENTDVTAWSIVGFIYTVCPFMIMMSFRGNVYSYLPIILAFSSDTMAYIIGITLGRHKAFPRLSPNKSIEGVFGGLAGSVLALIILRQIFTLNYLSMPQVIIMGILSSLTAQLGDLFASKIKREYNIKDFGFIFPGHGGVLDRFDSVLAVTLVVFLITSIIG